MPRPLYSSRLLAWSTDESPAPFTVPTGYVAVVRDIDVWSGGGELTNVQVAVNAVAKFWAAQFTIESIAQVAQWRGRQVLLEGEDLVFSADGPTDGLISGYLLLSP